MDMRVENLNTSRKIFGTKVLALLFVISGLVFAAATFYPNAQPWGYVAPPVLNGSNLMNNDVYAYTPWFEDGTFRGDMIAFPVRANGTVSLLAPRWRAAAVLAEQNYLSGRNIATTDGAGTATPFLFDSLTADQQSMIGSEKLVDFIRGDRSNESLSGIRVRSAVLGDIVHSAPVFQGAPIAGYVFDDYLSFAEDNENRGEMIFVGANDGMLHAFDADDGTEVFAYIPSMVVPNLARLAEDPYDHYYFVDGFLTIEDAQWDSGWHSVLVGGLGAGGMGYYALDITDPSASSDTDAASKILWELHPGSTGGGNIGYSYSRASIVRLKKDGIWAAVFGNGYLSADGKASLFVVNIKTGEVIRELVVNGGDDNGLSSPTLVDADSDGYADTAYAGDLNGNLWKFDLAAENWDSWNVALSGWAFFTTTSGQAITTAPEVGRHPSEDGLMVYFGTGRLLGSADGTDKTTQAVYGLWDQGTSVSLSSLVRQGLKSASHSSGVPVRVASNNRPDWETNGGWVTPTEIASASVLDQGERVLQDVQLRDGRISFMSVNPTIASGDNWFMQLDAETGGAPEKIIIDTNVDNFLSVGDNVDIDGDGEVGNSPTERVVGQYQEFGLASRPVIGALGGSTDSALINHLTAITPFDVDNSDDPGLLGGHFDLDTSSSIYDFDDGVTDGHVHEWDDKYDLTTVNYMDFKNVGGDKLHEIDQPAKGIAPNTLFILTVGNTELSPGGVLEVNSTSMSVRDYHAAVNRYLTGTLYSEEVFPIYKTGKPSATEADAGVQELISLKLSFDAYAILSGDLIPTVTGCVKDNHAGGNGEYRNGALMLQALDASDIAAGFTYDEDLDQYTSGSTSLNGTHGYATSGLFWESTLFWHWDGDCYGDGDWETDYKACLIDRTVDCIGVTDEQAEKAKKKKKKKKKKEDPPVDPPEGEDPPSDDTPPGGETDPGHNVSNTTVGGSNDTGRLFWKELIPEE